MHMRQALLLLLYGQPAWTCFRCFAHHEACCSEEVVTQPVEVLANLQHHAAAAAAAAVIAMVSPGAQQLPAKLYAASVEQ
jgi:hypothetical protein